MTAKQIRKRIEAIHERLSEAITQRDELVAEMQDYFDERSEKWQESDKGDAYQASIDSLENVDIESLQEELGDAPTAIEEAA